MKDNTTLYRCDMQAYINGSLDLELAYILFLIDCMSHKTVRLFAIYINGMLASFSSLYQVKVLKEVIGIFSTERFCQNV